MVLRILIYLRKYSCHHRRNVAERKKVLPFSIDVTMLLCGEELSNIAFMKTAFHENTFQILHAQITMEENPELDEYRSA